MSHEGTGENTNNKMEWFSSMEKEHQYSGQELKVEHTNANHQRPHIWVTSYDSRNDGHLDMAPLAHR